MATFKRSKSGMKGLRPSIACFFYFLTIQVITAQAPEWSWLVQTEGSTGSNIVRLTIDSNENIYAVVSMMGAEGVIAGEEVTNLSSFFTPHLCKFDSNGNLIWKDRLGSDAAILNSINAITIDSNDNIYFTFDVVAITTPWEFEFMGTTIQSDKSRVVLLVRINTDGEVQWYQELVDTGESEATILPRALQFDDQDNLYFAVHQLGGPVMYGNTEVTSPDGDIVVGQMNLEGEVQWARQLGTPEGQEHLAAIAPVPGGGLICSSVWFGESFQIDGFVVTNPDALVGANEDRYIVKFNTEGAVQFLVREAGPASDYEGIPCATPDGGVVVFSSCYNPMTIGEVEIGNDNMSLSRYNSNGELLWAKEFATKGYAYALKRSASFTGDTYLLCFSYSGEHTNIDGELIDNAGGLSETNDSMIAEIDGNGNLIWYTKTSGLNGEYFYNVVPAPDGNIYACGYFDSESLELGEQSLTNSQTLINSGFLGKLESTTSLREYSKDQSLQISPNPASDRIQLTFSEPHLSGLIEILDMQGRQVKSIHRSGVLNTHITISDLRAGMYRVKIMRGNEFLTETFIKE